ncbi:unnamed protein product [Parajaminaea phylloscopi]
MPTGFDDQKFNASEYVLRRPIYQSVVFDLIKAWQEDGGGHFNDVLDLGCGPGSLSYPLTQLFKNVVGMDPSPMMLAGARSGQVASTLGIKVPDGHTLSFQQGTAEDTGLPSKSFDLITVATAVHWLGWERDPTGDIVWKELDRLLRPGGQVMFIGYTPALLLEHEHIDHGFHDVIHDLNGFGKYFELSHAMSPTSVALSFYTLVPRPSSSTSFDAASTRIILFNSKERLSAKNTVQLREDVVRDSAALPQWVRNAGVESNEGLELLLHQTPSPQSYPSTVAKEVTTRNDKAAVPSQGTTTLRDLAAVLRTASAWPRYLNDHPEEAQILADGGLDYPMRLLDRLRKEEAQGSSDPDKLLDWDEPIPIIYPASVYVARKRSSSP